jgi:lipoprotein NlpI
LKKQAHTSCEKTEYYFYTGYKDLQAGQTSQANSKFNAAIAQNTYRFIERPLARYFLQKNTSTR